jgi:hypothetical protein
MRRFLVIATAALVLAPEAGAKVCASVSVLPSRPLAGERVEVRLATSAPRLDGRRVRPGPHLVLPASGALRVQVSAPSGAAFTLRLRRDAARRWLWRAAITFSTAGLWRLSPDDRRWAYAPRTCAPTRSVTVTSGSG